MQDKQVRPLVSAGSPRRARIPHHRAHRWLADGENGRAAGLQVFVTQPVFHAINSHSNSDLDNEVGGWLAGRWCRDIDTKDEFVVVEALLPAQQVRSGSTFLTFTHDSQVAMLAALEERYVKKGIVGWYHTHPRMGLFLSGYDVWLHEHFFPYHWQVALVVDPHSYAGGFFVRDRKKALDSSRYVGFYELLNRKGESVVDWRNLHAEHKLQPKLESEANSATQPGKPAAVQPAAAGTVEPQAAEVPEVNSAPPAKKADVKVNSPTLAAINERSKRPEIKTADTQPVEVKKVVATKGTGSTPEHRQGVLRKLEGPKSPPTVSLRKKDESDPQNDKEAPASQEVQK